MSEIIFFFTQNDAFFSSENGILINLELHIQFEIMNESSAATKV